MIKTQEKVYWLCLNRKKEIVLLCIAALIWRQHIYTLLQNFLSHITDSRLNKCKILHYICSVMFRKVVNN
jgi:hypothetical protein